MNDQVTEAWENPNAESLLTAARTALGAGQARLAIHLYYAAYELAASQTTAVAPELVEGMRIAWNLACEMGDRSTAESLCNELEPFNTQEQQASYRLRLQSLAPEADALNASFSSEESNGVLNNLVQALASGEGHEDFDYRHWLAMIKATLSGDENAATTDQDGGTLLVLPASSRALAAKRPSSEAPARPEDADNDSEAAAADEDEQLGWRLDYNHIVGFDEALAQMRSYGFYRRDEKDQHRFAERIANLHGVPRLSLSQPFLFRGVDPSDVNFFARATATEIGFPLLDIHVDINDRGNGMIKISGPFRHRFFGGPPDLTDLRTPCTVLLENLDALQRIFQADQRALANDSRPGPEGWDGQPRHNLQLEFGSYLRELINKPGVFFMATGGADYQLDATMTDIIGPAQIIQIDQPTAPERRQIWERLKLDHASLQGLSTEQLVEFSEGQARSALFALTNEVLETAYRDSLTQNRYQSVRMSDLLVALAAWSDQKGESYQRLEDAAVREFWRDLEDSY
ncbi:MAG: hypothetical protein FWC59_00155 [Actinomycetia bacterium]|nr:hypothetical protein [Actinomycetes bacterium]